MKGIIYISEANSPVNMFPKLKPNGEIRLLVDLIPRNKITIKDNSRISNQQMILRAVARAKYWSTIDLSNWYFQIRVASEDEQFNTIKTPFRSFACKVMLQGDCNAPPTVMQGIENVLDRLIGLCIWAYMDYITIFLDTFEEHIQHVRQVCQQLQNHKICASPTKCKFFADKLPLLGHVIDYNSIYTDPEKIRDIQDWLTLKSKKEVQKFISIVIYNAQFLPHLSTILVLLSDLTSQDEFE